MSAVIHTLEDLKKLQDQMLHTYLNPLPERPQTPASVTATGLKFGFRIQWPMVDGVSGYRVAMTSTNNLESPEVMTPLIWGAETQQHDWFYGDTTLVRQFSVQSFKMSTTGEILYSEFVRPLAAATSKADGGVADGAPTTVASPTAPSTQETVGDPGGVTSTGKLLTE